MDTTHYLSIIRKADFIDLFKYGHFYVYAAIEFDGDIKAHANDDELFEKLTTGMNLYEYSFEYMVLHFICTGKKSSPFSVNIENVKGLYTFDEDAKKEMIISFDYRIKLQVSPWSEKFKEWHLRQQISQNMQGINHLWAIFNLSESDRKKCESIITDDIISEVFNELFYYRRPVGKQSIWTYLLRYERHSFYPKNIKGYFCDYIHVVCNWMKGKEYQEEVAEATTIYSHIIDCTKNDFASLSNIATKSKLPSLTDEYSQCRFAVAAPLFLYMKDMFSNGFNVELLKPNFIEYTKEFGFESSIAVYLLGLTLGYDKTYDAYYDFIKLSIFASFSMEGNKKPKNWMRRKNKKSGNNDLQPAFNDEDIKRLEREGYKIGQRFSADEKSKIEKWGINHLNTCNDLFPNG